MGSSRVQSIEKTIESLYIEWILFNRIIIIKCVPFVNRKLHKSVVGVETSLIAVGITRESTGPSTNFNVNLIRSYQILNLEGISNQIIFSFLISIMNEFLKL